MKYKLPNHTQVPNDFIDKDMKTISGNDAKVYLVICRKTIGWHKEADYISISQIVNLTGISNRVVIKCINNLAEKKFIAKERTKHTTRYTINFEPQNDELSQEEAGHRVTKRHLQNDETSPVEGKTYDETSHTKEIIKKTHIKESPRKTHNTFYNNIREWFNTNNPSYYHDAKQAKHIKNITTRTEEKNVDIYPLLAKYKTLIDSDDKFWSTQPLTPAGFYSLWDRVDRAMECKQEETWDEIEKRIRAKGLI